MPRTSTLDQLDNVEPFAHDWAEGATQAELAEKYEKDIRTIRRWQQRDDVKLAARKFIDDRALKIKRATDGKILAAIEKLDPVDDIKELLAIRRDFATAGSAEADLTEEELLVAAMEELDSKPELAERLQKVKADADAGQ